MPIRRLPLSLLASVLALAGCGPTTPTLAPTPTAAPANTAPPPSTGPTRSAADVYGEIRTAVVAIRGLRPTAAVDPVTIDEAQLRKNFQAEFDAQWTPTDLKIAEDLLIGLGLLPEGASLRALTLDFQAGQVAGYYSPNKDELFVVSRTGGGVGPVEEVTYAHEFTHQLQDQNINLDTLGIDVADQSDRSLARLALVEGDAVSVQTAWMTANLTPREMGEVLAAGLDPAALEALQRAPTYLRDTALFPYDSGLALVTRLTLAGGYDRVNAAFADPPDSTEQVLHPEKYLQREAPIHVSLPDRLATDLGAGWSEAGQDTLGELILRIWLRQGGVPVADARVAATGWGGDRVVLLRGPSGKVQVALLTRWDSAADADEFAAAAKTALAGLGSAGRLAHRAGSTTVAIAIGPDAAALVAGLAP